MVYVTLWLSIHQVSNSKWWSKEEQLRIKYFRGSHSIPKKWNNWSSRKFIIREDIQSNEVVACLSCCIYSTEWTQDKHLGFPSWIRLATRWGKIRWLADNQKLKRRELYYWLEQYIRLHFWSKYASLVNRSTMWTWSGNNKQLLDEIFMI